MAIVYKPLVFDGELVGHQRVSQPALHSRSMLRYGLQVTLAISK